MRAVTSLSVAEVVWYIWPDPPWKNYNLLNQVSLSAKFYFQTRHPVCFRLIRSAVHLEDPKFQDVFEIRETKVWSSSPKFLFLLVECEQLIWEHAQRAPISPCGACVVVAYRVPRVIAFLRSVCVVLPAMTTGPLKSSKAFRQWAWSIDISDTLARVRNHRGDNSVIPNLLSSWALVLVSASASYLSLQQPAQEHCGSFQTCQTLFITAVAQDSVFYFTHKG